MIYTAHQDQIRLPELREISKKNGIKKWVYLGEDTRWRIHAEKILSAKIPKISIAELLEEESWRLRKPFIDTIGMLSEQNNSVAWWASEIPAKDPYNPLYLRICLLSVGIKLIRNNSESSLLIIATSSALLHELKQSGENAGIQILPITAGGFFPTLLQKTKNRFFDEIKSLPPIPGVKKISSRYSEYLEGNPLFRKGLLRKNGINLGGRFTGEKTILFYTYIDGRSFSRDGHFQDPHFGRLPFLFMERGYKVAFIPRILGTIPFEEAVLRLRKTRELFFFPELYIERSDIKKCEQQALAFKPQIPDSLTVGEVPVYRLITENLDQNRQTLSTNLVQDVFINQLSENGISPGRFIFTCEGQSWENSLLWSTRSNMPETKMIAYDNVTFSKMFLSKFHSAKEYKIRPLPHMLVTNGPLFSNILIQEGFPDGKVRTGCALRHSYLWENTSDRERSPSPCNKRGIKILVAAPIGYGESLELIQKACAAFGGDPGTELVIKCHPLTNIRSLKRDLGEALENQNITLSDEPVSSLLNSADILLYTTTSVCYEALVFGIPPICVHLENFLTLDRLDIVPGIRWVASTPDQLRVIVRSIAGMDITQKTNWENDAYNIVKSALAPVEPPCIEVFLN